MSSKDKWADFRKEMQMQVEWIEVAEKILNLELVGKPTVQGWVPCRSVDGGDQNPSASYNIQSGYYKDHREGSKAMSAFDLMYELGLADSFQEAQRKIAQHFQIKMPDIGPGDVLHGVKWQEWRDHFAVQFCKNKEGITPEALKTCDARFCTWHKQPAVALPVLSTNQGHQIIGWMFLPRNAPFFDMGHDSTAKSICKTFGDEKGFVCGYETMEAIMSETHRRVFWTEGAPDMLAGLSRFPDELWLTNPHGCSETVSQIQRHAVKTGDHKWIRIADADLPGIAGAAKQNKELDGALTVYCPPYEISEDKGHDYRDYLIENKIGEPLQGMVKRNDHAEQLAAQQQEREIEEFDRQMEKKMNTAKRMLEKLGIHILSVDEVDGVEIYSEATKTTKTIGQVSRIQYDDMVQLCGPKFAVLVSRNPQELQARETGGYLLQDVKTALALASTDHVFEDVERVGPGIWPVEGQDRDRTGDLILVKQGEVHKYNGKFERVGRPIIGRMSAKLSTKLQWYNTEAMEALVPEAQSVEWRQGVYQQLYDLFRQWNWASDQMIELAAGLYLATWIQAMQDWRPIVTLTGESNAGKTVLMSLINDLYLGLASFSARSTAAGVLQSLGDSSRPCLLDEFDSGQEQVALLERFRVASRGQESLYGTANQSGKTYKIHHIAWLSGIYAASRSQADVNRMINLRILRAKNNAHTINIPPKSELRVLGHKLLAGIVVSASDALRMTRRLTATEGSSIQSRYRESYSVPYGALGAFLGLDYEAVEGIMTQYLDEVVSTEVSMLDAESDQEALLLDIMASEVRMPTDGSCSVSVATVAEILFRPEMKDFRDHCRTKGIGYIIPKKGGSFAKVAIMGRRIVNKGGILKGTEWDGNQGLLQILERLPSNLKPKKERQCVAGVNQVCVTLDYDGLRKWAYGEKGRIDTLKLEGS